MKRLGIATWVLVMLVVSVGSASAYETLESKIAGGKKCFPIKSFLYNNFETDFANSYWGAEKFSGISAAEKKILDEKMTKYRDCSCAQAGGSILTANDGFGHVAPEGCYRCFDSAKALFDHIDSIMPKGCPKASGGIRDIGEATSAGVETSVPENPL